MQGLFFTVFGKAAHYFIIFIVKREANGLVPHSWGNPKAKKGRLSRLHRYLFINDTEQYASGWYSSSVAKAFYLRRGYNSRLLHPKPWQLGE